MSWALPRASNAPQSALEDPWATSVTMHARCSIIGAMSLKISTGYPEGTGLARPSKVASKQSPFMHNVGGTIVWNVVINARVTLFSTESVV